jgi:ADP-ribosylglycohydrolase
MGNGAAMRVAPLGAYFADDYSRVVSEARLSAEVTHAHAEGQAGAIAVAAAAAFAWNTRKGLREDSGTQLLRCVLEHTPAGDTRRGIEQALSLSRDLSWQTAASLLGNGGKLSAPDTVPFCLWCAARHLGDYEVALWTTVAGLGDMDTNCAIVGGIVALSVGADSIPRAWLNAREPV